MKMKWGLSDGSSKATKFVQNVLEWHLRLQDETLCYGLSSPMEIYCQSREALPDNLFQIHYQLI